MEHNLYGDRARRRVENHLNQCAVSEKHQVVGVVEEDYSTKLDHDE